MVMISDPAAIKALYTERSHGLPPGRDIILTPIVGARSLLVTEGADHLAHRKLMLPPFHGERMRSYQPLVEEIVDREIDSWPLGEEFAIHPRMQAITLEVILKRRLRRRRRPPLRAPAHRPDPGAGGDRLALRPAGRPRLAPLRRPRALGQVRKAAEAWPTSCSTPRSPSTAPAATYEEREDILSLLMQARFEDGTRDERLRPARPADDPAARRPRDHGDGAGLDLRPAAPPPAPLQRLRDSLEEGEDDYLRARSASRCACARSCRSPAAGSAWTSTPRTQPARRHRRHPGDLAHPHPRRLLPRALRLPPRALPRGRARHLRLDPLRRRHPPLHRRRLRRVRDADRPARGADPLRAAQGQPGAGEDRPPQHHPLAASAGTPVVLTARHPARERDLVAA